MSIDAYARQRDDLLRRIVTELEADSRVVAAWLSGSFGRGTQDAWSDFDLHIAIEDEALDDFWSERESRYARIAPPLLIQHEMVQPGLEGSRFQLVWFPGPVEVDWVVGAESHATRQPESTMLIERRPIPVDNTPPADQEARRAIAQRELTFFWAMMPIAIKFAGRGDTRRAVTQLDLLYRPFMHLWRLICLPGGPDPTANGQNRATEPELDAVIPRIGPVIDPASALRTILALGETMQALHPALAELGATVSPQFLTEIETLARIAASEIARDPDPAGRVFR